MCPIIRPARNHDCPTIELVSGESVPLYKIGSGALAASRGDTQRLNSPNALPRPPYCAKVLASAALIMRSR